jgi:tungstate transport system ATP-binding protein
MLNPSPFILEARALRVRRGGSLLLDLPFLRIAEGETLALIGPNGAGKTTLLQTLAHLAKPFEGEIFFRGQPVNSDASGLNYRRKLGMVFQEALLFDTTVFQNVASGLKIRGMKGADIEPVVMDHLSRFGISHLCDRSARTLSGGEAQRTSLARAFAIKPEILFLDEPFASLDPPSRESLITDLEGILRETKTTTILATHDRTEAIRLSDRMAVMLHGKVLQIGSPGEVMNHPADEFVASFVGVETLLTGKVTRKNAGSFIVSISGCDIEAVGEFEEGEEVVLCIRPENVTLSELPSREKTSARNVFPARIERVVPMGLFHKVDLDCGFLLTAYITTHSLQNLSLEEGKEMRASFKATSIHVLRRTRK